MIDFLNDIMEAITKKHIIIGSIILAFIITCIVAIIMLCSSTKDISSTVKVERAVNSEVYTVEIESSPEVSAESIYQKLASDNSEIKLLSMDDDKEPHIVSLSSDTVIDSSLEICFADGNLKKDFTNVGEYDETLIIHNQVDQSMSSLNVKLMVIESDVEITTTTEALTTKEAVTSRTSRITVSTTTKITAVSVSANDYDEDYYYELNNEYDYYDEYNDYEDEYYEYDEEYDYNDNSGEYIQVDNEQTDTDNTYNNSSNYDSNNNESELPDSNTDDSNELKFETAEDFGWTGTDADLFNYAISQGCNVWQASAYVTACANYGTENIFIGLTPADSSCWGVWYYDDSTETYRAA